MMAEVFNFQFSTDKCSIYRGREILNEIDSMGKRQCCSACASIVLICRSNTSGKFLIVPKIPYTSIPIRISLLWDFEPSTGCAKVKTKTAEQSLTVNFNFWEFLIFGRMSDVGIVFVSLNSSIA